MATAYAARATGGVPATFAGRPPAIAPRTALLLAGVLLVALYVTTRLIYVADFPYFIDEGTYAQFTLQGSRSLHNLFVSLTIGREPLQIWLGIPFVKLGFNPLVANRLVSCVAGLLTLVPVSLVAHRIGGRAVALAAATLCVLLPFLFVHDGIGIMEPLVALIMASALWLSVELARAPSLRLGVALGVVLGAGLLTKENTLPAVVLAPVGLLCFDWSPAGRRARLRTWAGAAVIAVAFLVGAELLLRSSSYYPVYVAQRKLTYYTVRPLHTVLTHPFATWGTTWGVYRAAFIGYVTVPLIALAAVGAGLALRGPRRLAVVLIVWLGFGFLISMLFAAFPFPRHVMYLMPPAIVFMAYGFVAGARRLQRALPGLRGAALTALAAALLLFPALRFDARALAHPATVRYPGRDELQYVTGTGSGAAWPGLTAAIRRYGEHRSHVTVISPTADVAIPELLLAAPRKYAFVSGSSPLAAHAQLAVTDEIPFADLPALTQFRRGRPVLIETFHRLQGGPPVSLYRLQANQ